MQNSRVARDMHTGADQGTVVFAWPMTKDVAGAFGIETDRTGLMIAMRPNAGMLAKFQSGEADGHQHGIEISVRGGEINVWCSYSKGPDDESDHTTRAPLAGPRASPFSLQRYLLERDVRQRRLQPPVLSS